MPKLQTMISSVALIGFLAFSGLFFAPAAVSAQGQVSQTLKQLFTPPADSVDAENVRIWLGRERRNTCRVTIDIHDDSGRVVRHLLNEVLPWGYYNFYWDKKDDSGRFVAAGEYPYVVDNCGTEKKGTVTADFRDGEAAFDVYPESPDSPGLIPFEILKDSVRVSWMIATSSGRALDTIAVDSLMNSGHYSFQWKPEGPMRPGVHWFTMTVGEFTRRTAIRRPL